MYSNEAVGMTIFNGVVRRRRKSLQQGTGDWKFMLVRLVVTETSKITGIQTVTPLNEVLLIEI
jgi:hypothetical protein